MITYSFSKFLSSIIIVWLGETENKNVNLVALVLRYIAAKNEKIPLPLEQERQSLMSDGTEKNYNFGRFDLKISKVWHLIQP